MLGPVLLRARPVRQAIRPRAAHCHAHAHARARAEAAGATRRCGACSRPRRRCQWGQHDSAHARLLLARLAVVARWMVELRVRARAVRAGSCCGCATSVRPQRVARMAVLLLVVVVVVAVVVLVGRPRRSRRGRRSCCRGRRSCSCTGIIRPLGRPVGRQDKAPARRRQPVLGEGVGGVLRREVCVILMARGVARASLPTTRSSHSLTHEPFSNTKPPNSGRALYV